MCKGNIQRLTKLYNYVKIGGEKNFEVPEYYILELFGKNKAKGGVSMFKIYMTDKNIIREETRAEPGCWVHMIRTTSQECAQICEMLGVSIDTPDLLAALDEEESARVEMEEDYT